MVYTPLDIYWKQLLWDCNHHGKTVKKDDSEIKELMGNYIFIERPQDIPLPFNKKIDDVHEFSEGLKKGLYDIVGYPIKKEALYDYATSWEDNNHIYLDPKSREELNIKGKPFVYTYPERLLRQYTTSGKNKDWYADQYNIIYNRLSRNKGSNRAVATLYNPGLDYNKEDIPCLNWLQATIRDQKLELHCMFRSNDLYGAWPANMYLLTFIGLSLTKTLENEYPLTFNGIHYHSSSLHIYKTDLPAVEKILKEK